MDLVLIYAQGSWGTISAVCFLLSAFFSDLILIRFWLLIAYIFLLLQGALGLPGFNNWTGFNGQIAVGIVAFAAAGCIVHTGALLLLFWDERHIRLKSEDEEQLWRLFYRRSGMNRLEFQACQKLGKWIRYKAGDVIFDVDAQDPEDCLSVSILVEGLVRFAPAGTPNDLEKAHMWLNLYSGALFSFMACNCFGIFLGFETDEMGIVVAQSDVLVFQWQFTAVEKLASGISPSTSGFWRNLLTFQMANELNRARYQAKGEKMAYSADGEPEEATYFTGGRTRDLTLPLRDWEIERFTWCDFWRWIFNSLSVVSPLGVRHNALPKSGQLARGRLQARLTLHFLRSASLSRREMSMVGGPGDRPLLPAEAVELEDEDAEVQAEMSRLRRERVCLQEEATRLGQGPLPIFPSASFPIGPPDSPAKPLSRLTSWEGGGRGDLQSGY
eukprot:jgi/Botrbrau1/18897/Bobra.177_2s0055.1